jgi:acyl-CoA synthetase (AMP-forming)/AMP-acid ligase II
MESGDKVPRFLIELAREAAKATPDRSVFLGEGTPATCASLLSDSDALAHALAARGLRPGDVIGFQLPNWVEAAVINLAACRLGLICMPLMPIYRDAELTFMLHHSNCRAIFTAATFRSYDFLELYSRILPALHSPPLLFTVRESRVVERGYEWLIEHNRGCAVAEPELQLGSPKLLLYTSGTTGKPKAVLHSHRTLARAILATAEHWRIGSNDVILMPSPITHATGYANALELPFLLGTQTVLMDRWDARQAVELIDRWRASVTVGATPFLRELTDAAKASHSDLGSLRVFACGGAPVPEEVISNANRVFRNRPAFRVYGSSEAPYVAVGRPCADDPETMSKTDGEVIDYDIKIIDQTGNELMPGGEGEILVRGPSLFLGYADAADNRDCFTQDGYFRTGDLGFLGPGRLLSISGRKKDLIIRGGENISAREVENALDAHPQIVESAVVAMPHARLGEGVFAFLITRDQAAPSLAEVQAFLLTRHLAKQKWPEQIEVVMSFPRTPSGKVRKDLLRGVAAVKINGATVQHG